MSKEFKSGDDFIWVPTQHQINGVRIRYGIWEFNIPKDSIQYRLHRLSTTGINELLLNAKFYKLSDNSGIVVREQQSIIDIRTIADCKDFIKEYLQFIPDEGIWFEDDLGGASKLELEEVYYRQYNLVLNKNYLEHLDIVPKPILQDGPDVSYVPFRNTVVVITKDTIRTTPYNEMDGHVVWKDQIISKEYNGICNYDKSHFVRFVRNVTNRDEARFESFKSALGYLMNSHSLPSKGQAVILYDQTITDTRRPQGGTGKGLIANALKQVRCVIKIDGKRYNPEDRFKFQLVKPSSQIVWLDDPKPSFDFTDLFSCLTDGLTIEKKHQKSILIEPDRSPKFLLCSNSIIETQGSSNKRRQFILELSDYYSKQICKGNEEPIIAEHGCIFFDDNDWDQHEWDMFYSFMFDCTKCYLEKGLIYLDPLNVAANRLAQLTSDEFYEWSTAYDFEVQKPYNTKELFEEFRNIYFGEDSNLKQRWFTKQLREYAIANGWRHRAFRSNGQQLFEFAVV